MDNKLLGKLVARSRKRRSIGRQELGAGICTASTVLRLETGERMPDFFVLERILERLGMSGNKLEFLHDETAYEIYYLRELVEKYLTQKEYQEAAGALSYYESLPEGQQPLHRQYICKMQAVIAGEANGEWERAVCLLEEAIALTISDFAWDDQDNRMLGESELVLLLMRLQAGTETGKEPPQADSPGIFSYIGKHCADREAYANVYSKAAWVLGNIALKRQNREEALSYALLGENVLADNGWLLHLPQFLERILSLTEGETNREWKKQRDALRQVYEEYGEPWETGQIELWRNYRQQEVYLVSELFSQERSTRKQSQKRLAEELDIDQKTISRIENGRYRPKPGTFRKMKEYLGLDRDIVSTRLVVDDLELLEVERQIAGQGQYRNVEKGKELYLYLKSKLSLDYHENRQYVEFQDAFFAKEEGKITAQEAIDRCWEAFAVTRGNISQEQIGQVVLGRMEATIINYIALRYDELGRREDAIVLLEKVKAGYENSRVDTKYHYVGVSLVYEHLSDAYERCGYLDKALEMCDIALRYELRCQKGCTLGFLVDQKAFTQGKITQDKEAGKKSYRQAYQLHKLMKMEKSRIRLQIAYEKIYHEEIDYFF